MGELSFELGEEQAILRESVRKFVQAEIIPVAQALDEASTFPSELLKKAHSLGFLNITIDDSLGGSGLSNVGANVVIEELAYGCAGVTTSIVVNDLALLPIVIGGTSEQHRQFVSPIAESGTLASFCLSEPSAGSDAGGLSTKLEKVEGGYRLSGTKQWITNGGKADQYTVFATLDPKKKHKGICCVVVPASAEGVSHGPHENKLGQRCSNTTTVHFDNVFVPESARIGLEGEGFGIAMRTLDISRPMTAAIAVGIARRALDESVRYAKERKQFGKSIGEFQGVQFILADAVTEIEAARLLTYRAAWLIDQGHRASMESSMAKRFAADTAMKVAT
ncbi:MAG: acyl-CoA dehydrogenase family protein, partial [Bdellovibrionales bacterium]|nr:acyl-CoA dehydrogenase family protein [Bdellovibrionales bacterium]